MHRTSMRYAPEVGYTLLLIATTRVELECPQTPARFIEFFGAEE